MTSDEELRLAALAQLTSRNPHDRYLGAKALYKLANPDDLAALMNARRVETDNTALRWLESAIVACAKRAEHEAQQQGPLEPVIEPEAIQSIRAQAIEWIAGVLLHEIGAKIGLLSSAARDEINSYENSRTAKHIKHLELIFEGILHLRKAAATPSASEFDLAELVESIVALEAATYNVDVSLVGRKPLILFSDSNLVRLALCNGIRNALEAVQSVEEIEKHGIVINWGVTDSEFWVSVIDQGVGLVPVGETAFEIGKTTKDGHAGFGLAIARQAMEKLNGTVTLARSVAGGATYEIKGKLIQ